MSGYAQRALSWATSSSGKHQQNSATGTTAASNHPSTPPVQQQYSSQAPPPRPNAAATGGVASLYASGKLPTSTSGSSKNPSTAFQGSQGSAAYIPATAVATVIAVGASTVLFPTNDENSQTTGIVSPSSGSYNGNNAPFNSSINSGSQISRSSSSSAGVGMNFGQQNSAQTGGPQIAISASSIPAQISNTAIVNAPMATFNSAVAPASGVVLAAVVSTVNSGGAASFINAAAGAASQIGNQVLSTATSQEVLGFLSMLSNAAVTIPLAGAVAVVLKSVIDAATAARYNYTAAGILFQRAKEVGSSLADLLQTVRKSSKSLEQQLMRMKEVLEDCNQFLDKFSKRSYLSRLIRGESDSDNVRRLDKEMGDCISNIQLSLGVQQISLQQRTLDQLEIMQRSVAKCTHTNEGAAEASVLQMTKADMEQLAAVCRIPVNEITDEVTGMCAEILASQARIEEQLVRIEKVVIGDDAALKFWNTWFAGEKFVPVTSFLPILEEEYNDGNPLTEKESETLVNLIDNNPTDGSITLLKWKRFFRAKGSFKIMEFIRISAK